MRLNISEFHSTGLLLDPLIVPILRRLITDGDVPDGSVVARSEDPGHFAVWRWALTGTVWELAVHLHFRRKDAVITSLWVHYAEPIVADPQFNTPPCLAA